MPYRLVLPPIPPEQRTPLVEALVGMIQIQAERIQRQEEQIELLKEEIRILKGLKKRPRFKPSGMEEQTEADKAKDEGKQDSRRPGSDKRGKTAKLVIHEEKIIAPSRRIPRGSRFKGYRDVVVQELQIQCHNTRYRLERWVTPQGKSLCAELPAELAGHHFGAKLRSYILYQHHHCQVTQPLLHEQLLEWGVEISSGQIDAILTSDQDPFHAEKDALLKRGLATADYVTVDDSGARHQGHNGYVTQIGNAFFAWFCSTLSKSRINFLMLLCAGEVCYRINPSALEYMGEQGLPAAPIQALVRRTEGVIEDTVGWEAHLDRLGIHLDRHRRIATEGALLGTLAARGLTDLVVLSDDAGQFKVLQHALCWIHSERLIHTMLPLNEDHRQDIERVRDQLWGLYADLKAYKLKPRKRLRHRLERDFDALFKQKTRYQGLNELLKRLLQNKAELLRVLERPEIPLHTNDSERDVRDYVKKRKVSGGTRSDLGRRCRDTFISLKKTCRKLGVSFWDYLTDRISQTGLIPPLPDLVAAAATA
jgi:hypothetical protein